MSSETALKKLFNLVVNKLDDNPNVNLPGKETRLLMRKVQKSDKEFENAGSQPGLLIWRVQDFPATSKRRAYFNVVPWPRDEYGSFFSGDSYIVLNTYKPDASSDRLAWDLHFWLGRGSTQDETGVAAIKAVELDHLLEDGAIQHRECQGAESKLFQSYFKEITYLEGGMPNGFTAMTPKDYQPRLFMVRQASKVTRAFEIEVTATKMNHGDSYILDCGDKVYRWVGESSNANERNRSAFLQSNLVTSRNGKAVKAEVDEHFWEVLGGSMEDVRPADDPYIPDYVKEMNQETLNVKDLKLFRIYELLGYAYFNKISAGDRVQYQDLKTENVYLIDSNIGIWVWIGKETTKKEKSLAITLAMKYIRQNNLPENTTVAILQEQNAKDNHLFSLMIKY